MGVVLALRSAVCYESAAARIAALKEATASCAGSCRPAGSASHPRSPIWWQRSANVYLTNQVSFLDGGIHPR